LKAAQGKGFRKQIFGDFSADLAKKVGIWAEDLGQVQEMYSECEDVGSALGLLEGVVVRGEEFAPVSWTDGWQGLFEGHRAIGAVEGDTAPTHCGPFGMKAGEGLIVGASEEGVPAGTGVTGMATNGPGWRVWGKSGGEIMAVHCYPPRSALVLLWAARCREINQFGVSQNKGTSTSG
jgi:hypothetical protein